MVNGNNLAGYQVKGNGSDGCRVCFVAKQYAIGVVGERLQGVIVSIEELVMPDDENTSKRAFYHHNRGYTIAQVYNS
jgi:hypothetical protein